MRMLKLTSRTARCEALQVMLPRLSLGAKRLTATMAMMTNVRMMLMLMMMMMMVVVVVVVKKSGC